jgi:histone arginine demethylase JMJD6
MESYADLEQSIRQELEADGIELLLPVIPDCFLSDDEDDIPKNKQHNSDSWNIEDLRQQYHDAFEIMKTSPLNNHSNRNLHTNREYYQNLRQNPVNSFSKAIQRIHVSNLSKEQFHYTFVSNSGLPVMIEGIPETENWSAKDKWSTPERIIEHYGNVPIKVMEKHTEHGMGRAFCVRIPIALYYEYSNNNTADDPFYGFEHDFSEKREVLLEDYSAPSYFKDDFYNLNEKTREFYPNYRHFIIGAERTGTNLHVDPKCTGAWNTLLFGHKKWVLFPPSADEKYTKELGVKEYSKQPSTYWWKDILPNLSAEKGIIECIQNPGETIFVPAGWWHAVLNLDFTIAITENLLIPETLPRVWSDLKGGWPKFTEYIEETQPDLIAPFSSTTAKTPVSSLYY